MDKDKQDYLFLKYPKLFRQKDLPMSQTCLCWGIECSSGWFNLIDNMCRELQELCDKTDEKVEFVQVKEKFGGLRAYTGSVSEKISNEVRAIIAKYEELSFKTCEICGKEGKCRQKRGWYNAICEVCDKEIDEKEAFRRGETNIVNNNESET